MMKQLSKLILRLWGWKVVVNSIGELKKCVVIVAPHTSNMDFVVGRLAYFTLGLKVKFLIKKESFFFPLGILIKKMGGIPVDRGKSSNLVEDVAKIFNESEDLFLTVTPEGTRKLVTRWKKGFYYIAYKANVPIALGILDYKHKVIGIGKMLYPTGNYEEDFKIIEAFYKGGHARHPEKFNLS